MSKILTKLEIGAPNISAPIIADAELVTLVDEKVPDILDEYDNGKRTKTSTGSSALKIAHSDQTVRFVYIKDLDFYTISSWFIYFCNESGKKKCLKNIKHVKPVNSTTKQFSAPACRHVTDEACKNHLRLYQIMTTEKLYNQFRELYESQVENQEVVRNKKELVLFMNPGEWNRCEHIPFIILENKSLKLNLDFTKTLSYTINVPFTRLNWSPNNDDTVKIDLENSEHVYVSIGFNTNGNVRLFVTGQYLGQKTTCLFSWPQDTVISPNYIRYSTFPIILEGFKESIYSKRNLGTEQIIRELLAVRAGFLYDTVPWWILFKYLINKLESEGNLPGHTFPPYDMRVHASSIRPGKSGNEYDDMLASYYDYSVYALSVGEKTVNKLSDYSEKDIPEISKLMRQHKMMMVHIPELYVDEFIENLKLINVSSDYNIPVSLTNYEFTAENDNYFESVTIRELNKINEVDFSTFNASSFPKNIFDIVSLHNEFTSDTEYGPMYAALQLGHAYFSFILTKPSFQVPTSQTAVIKNFFPNSKIKKVTRFDWSDKDAMGVEIHNLFYPNCTSRAYGMDWVTYLKTTPCFLIVFQVSPSDSILDDCRSMGLKSRKDSNLIWTRNILHIPTDLEEYNVNLDALRKYSKFHDAISYLNLPKLAVFD